MDRKTRTLAAAAGPLALAALLAVAAGAAAPAQKFRDAGEDLRPFKTETIAKTLRFAEPAKPGRLQVDNLFGPITVEAYAGRDVVLEVEKTVYARDEARARKAEAEVRLDLTEKDNTVEAYVDGPFREDEKDRREGVLRMRRDPGYRVYYGFTVKVPARTDLVLSTVLDGDIEVRGVEGTFDVRNVNGRVRLLDAAGAGEARTVNGGVTVLFRRSPDGACVFKTVNGDVEVDFPAPPSADFRVRTMTGAVYSDFDVTALPKAAPVREERPAKGGKFVFRSDGFVGVRAGRGGPEIRLETLAGDILIAKRTRSIS